MKVKVKMSPLLRQLSQLTKEPDTTYVSAPNPIECLQNMADQFPSIKKWVYDKQGRVLPQVHFFVNGEKLLADELASPLNNGDELFIVLAIGGG